MSGVNTKNNTLQAIEKHLLITFNEYPDICNEFLQPAPRNSQYRTNKKR